MTEIPTLVPTVLESVENADNAPEDLPDTPENKFLHQYLRQEDKTLSGHTLQSGARRPPLPHSDDYITKHVAYENFPDQPLPGQALRDAARDSSVPRDGPPGRWLHTAVWIKGEMVVFGGVSNEPRELVNDIWAFEYNEATWMQIRFPTAEGDLFPNPKAHGDRDRTDFSPRPPNIPEGPAYIRPPDTLKPRSDWTGMTPSQRLKSFNKLEYGATVPLVLPTVPQPVDGGPVASETSELLQLDEKESMRIRPRAQDISSLQLLRNKLQSALPRTIRGNNADQLSFQQTSASAKARFARRAQASGTVHRATGGAKKATGKDASQSPNDPRLVIPGAPYTPLIQQLVHNTANDLWSFNIANNEWAHAPTVGLAPVPRWLHTAVVPKVSANQVMDPKPIASTKMWVYGGCSNALTLLNDVWELDVTTMVWKDLTPKDKPLMLPREGHSAAVIKDDTMIVYGGMSYSYRPLSDMWAFDGKKWSSMEEENKQTTMTTEPKHPPARWMHVAVAIQSPSDDIVMVVYGGCSADFTAMDDLWIFSSGGWSGIVPMSYDRLSPTDSIDHRDSGGPAINKPPQAVSYPPPARWLHTAVAAGTVNGRRLIVHGGAAGNIPMEDMWMLDTDQCLTSIAKPEDGGDCVWTEMFAAGQFPFAREGHTAVLVSHPQAPDAQSNPAAQDTGAASNAPTDPNSLEMFDGPSSPLDATNMPEEFETEPEERPPMDELRQRFKGRSVWRDLFVVIFGGAAEAGTVASMLVPT